MKFKTWVQNVKANKEAVKTGMYVWTGKQFVKTAAVAMAVYVTITVLSGWIDEPLELKEVLEQVD